MLLSDPVTLPVGVVTVLALLAALAAVDRLLLDYVLVAYLAATRTALSYAVGEWARIWPLQTLVRTMGAYFIRRNSKDPLYRLVLERYVAMATVGGVVQAIYPEGAAALMRSVGKTIPVLPVSLVSTAFLRHPGGCCSELELKAETLRIIGELSRAGAHIYIPRADQDYAVTVGLRMLTLRNLVLEKDGLYSPRPEELPLLLYYANSIRHLFPGTEPVFPA